MEEKTENWKAVISLPSSPGTREQSSHRENQQEGDNRKKKIHSTAHHFIFHVIKSVKCYKNM